MRWIFLICIAVYLINRQSRRLRGPPPDPDQLIGRYGPSDDSPQLAGSKCVHCEKKILSNMEATACQECNQPVHLKCRKDHRKDAHPKPSPSA